MFLYHTAYSCAFLKEMQFILCHLQAYLNLKDYKDSKHVYLHLIK